MQLLPLQSAPQAAHGKERLCDWEEEDTENGLKLHRAAAAAVSELTDSCDDARGG